MAFIDRTASFNGILIEIYQIGGTGYIPKCLEMFLWYRNAKTVVLGCTKCGKEKAKSELILKKSRDWICTFCKCNNFKTRGEHE